MALFSAGHGLAAVLRTDRGLFVVALAARAVLTVVYSGRNVAVSGLELGELADNLVAGRGFVWEFYGTDVVRYSFFPPFYPAFLALLKLVFGPAHWVGGMQAVQAVVSAGAAVVTRRLAGRVYGARDRGLALIAGYAVALWPPLVVYAAAGFSTTFEALAVTSIMVFLYDAGRTGRRRDAAKAGVGYGLLAYALPAFLGSLVLVPAGLHAMGLRWRRALLLTATTAGVALLVAMPWTVRNAAVHHRLVPMATNIGFNFVGSQNPHTQSQYNALCADDGLRWHVIDKQAFETTNEAAFDLALLRQGAQYAASRPLRTFVRCAERLFYHWWGVPDVVRYNRTQGLANLALMSVVLPLFVTGLVRSRRARGQYALLWCVFLWQSVFYMHFAMRGRYALPAHPLMLVVAVAGAAAVARGLARRPARSAHQG